jgi:biopolymer transport protein ExbD
VTALAVTLRQSLDDDLSEISQINVTPFIDVILVLLIIFMVAAPLSTVDIAVELPISTAEPQPRPDRPLYLTVRSDLTLTLGEASIAGAELRAALDQRTGGDREQRVFLRADRSIPYGDLMRVMNLLREAGYLKVALVALEDADQSNGEGQAASPSSDDSPQARGFSKP